MPRRFKTPKVGLPAYDRPMEAPEVSDPVRAMMSLQSEIDEFRYVAMEVLSPAMKDFRDERDQFPGTRLTVKMLEQYINGTPEGHHR